MPICAKLILSVLVTIVAVLLRRLEGQAGQEFSAWLALGLVLAMWLFPEPAA
jgi:hypothetical protein